jgi:hypothetical protein
LGPRGKRMGSGAGSTMRNRSSTIVRVIKSRRLRWAGHVVRTVEGRTVFKMLSGKPTGKGSLGRPRVGGRTIWTLKK